MSFVGVLAVLTAWRGSLARTRSAPSVCWRPFARGPLQLGVSGYGVLLGGLGVGAVLGALVVPAIRARGSPGVVLTAGTAAAQVVLPAWPRARALAYFQLTFMGGQAVGGVVWGALFEAWGTATALGIASAVLLATVPVARRWLVLHASAPDVSMVEHLPQPPAVPSPAGLVLVTLEWRVPAESAAEFVEAMSAVDWARRRTGARLWGLCRDAEDPECFVELFTVADWLEHMRQHVERGSAMDRDAEAVARRLVLTGTAPRVRHLLWAYGSKH